MIPSSEAPSDGQLVINVEMTALATPDYRPGKQPPITHSIQQRLQDVLVGCGVLQPSELCIAEGRAVWVLYLDLYILNAAGGLLDASLLAALAALQDTRLPIVHVTDEGNVERGAAEDEDEDAAAAAGSSSRPLQLHGRPLGLTCGLYKGQHIVADPDHEEEALMSASVSVVLDEAGELLGKWLFPCCSCAVYCRVMLCCTVLCCVLCVYVQCIAGCCFALRCCAVCRVSVLVAAGWWCFGEAAAHPSSSK
jgi:exosome complex component RRP43